MPRMTHFLLLQCRTDTPAGLAQAASQWCANSPVPLALHRVARQGETGAVYAYARLLSPCALSPSDLSACLRAWPSQESKVHAATVSRLALALDAPGISSAVQPVFHYVVEMDPEAGIDGLDLKFKDARGYRVGGGVHFAALAVNLEYEDLTYQNTDIQSYGILNATGSSDVDMTQRGTVVSLSFPFEL